MGQLLHVLVLETFEHILYSEFQVKESAGITVWLSGRACSVGPRSGVQPHMVPKKKGKKK